MHKLSKKAVIAIQVGLSFSVLVLLYWFYTYYFFTGSFEEYLYFIFHLPTISIVFGLGTFVFCVLAGLPIRFNKVVNNWWKRRSYLPIIIIILGLMSVALSLYQPLLNHIEIVDGETTRIKLQANSALGLIGSVFLTFGILHFYPKSHC